MTSPALPAGILLVLVFAPLSHALASAPEILCPTPTQPKDQAGGDQQDRLFDEYWRAQLGRLSQTPPNWSIWAGRELVFKGADGLERRAVLQIPAKMRSLAVYVTDGSSRDPVRAPSGQGVVIFPWRADVPQVSASLTAREHPLTRAISDTCRLVEVLVGMNDLPVSRVGLIGEGYGAVVALATAALRPELISYVVAHQPICPAEAVQRVLPADTPAAAEAALTASRHTRRLKAASFAARVETPVLITAGTLDECAPEVSIQAMYESLKGPREYWRLPGARHCTLQQVPDWLGRWMQWAAKSRSPV
ncbi:acetylxylan esterase [bacterium]|nr:acetylxylan esterase [bacterium]